MVRLYNLILLLAALPAVPYYGLVMLFTGKYRKSLGAKLGFGYPAIANVAQDHPRIWIHAVSVGEVTAAAPIVAALRAQVPDACIVVSTSTETGQAMAKNIMTEATSIIYYPLDFPFAVNRAIRWVNPDIVVLTETELWPNFIMSCWKRNIRIVMVNGRISPRSYKRYYATRFFWQKFLRHIDAMGMISAGDAERIMAIGMPPDRVGVFGNAKYDGLAARVSVALANEMACRLNIRPGERIFVAGSTHEGEETVVLRVYEQLLVPYPDMKLIIVPRHIDRGRSVLDLAKGCGFPDTMAMTEIMAGRYRRNERVIVVDVIGELFKIYGLATVVFCGGSLVPKGGQNILEAAAWGKIVFYGPSMEDFSDERQLLEVVGAGIPVRNGEELFQGILAAMGDSSMLLTKGQAAREAIAANRGSSGRYADLIMNTLAC